jgi:hypothetical protein
MGFRRKKQINSDNSYKKAVNTAILAHFKMEQKQDQFYLPWPKQSRIEKKQKKCLFRDTFF